MPSPCSTTKERPSPFMDEMARALLREADPKTQTRRKGGLDAVNECPSMWELVGMRDNEKGQFGAHFVGKYNRAAGHFIKPPLGQPGDRLWVRETWRPDAKHWVNECGGEEEYFDVVYKAGGDSVKDIVPPDDYTCPDHRGWCPSMFMPRWASRILLEITDVWCQRVQEISEEDARAEGVERYSHTGDGRFYDNAYRAGFQILWNSINAKPKPLYAAKKIVAYRSFPWDDVQETRTHRGKPHHIHGNPHVFAYSFRRLEP